MASETPYRLALLAVFGLSIAVTGYHRIQAARSRERISRRGEGAALFLAIRGSGVLLMLATLAYLLEPAWMEWSSWPLPDWLRWCGVLVAVPTIWFLYWTLSTLGGNLTDTVFTRANHTLVTSGPYRWVRHPFYVALLLLVSAAFLLTANWLIGALGLAVFLLLAVRTPIEEQKLTERFGDEYRRYMARTGRFVPRLG